MMYSSIGYSTRLNSDTSRKICGGSFGGGLDIDTANRLVNSQFDIIIKPSGTPVFVDKSGNEVFLYFTINPNMTEKGKKVIAEYKNQQAKKEKEKQNILNQLLDSLTDDEIIAKLSA